MKVAVVVGSLSDADYAAVVRETLESLGVESEFFLLSAHRTPDETIRFAKEAQQNGFGVIIAIAGYAAHLGGVIASHTILPVICVPVAAGPFNGVDAMLASLQMPKGVPTAVTTVGKAGAVNAALLAARILALSNQKIADNIRRYIDETRQKTVASCSELRRKLGL
ncbi:MAG: 5-(carboxyamino)imidazole ribonucleotide mutase [Planctomycetota bacterium]|nr:MAG: 5-(carboxyamino)imidazole ribonucleotide mutase [Planctomycetota bacterium]